MNAPPVPPFEVALVGRRLTDNENLGLGYLEAALAGAGVSCRRYALNRYGDIPAIAASLCQRRTPLLGLSLPDGGSALLPLALGELLRRRGFRGHITSGGPFATLARQWLLERYPWLGSVVRFAGEVPLVALARALAAGDPWTNLPGVTTRQGDGRCAPVLDDLPMRLRPLREEAPEILGHPVAHVLGSRGCSGRCTYCGPAALQAQERKEGLRGGASTSELDAFGIGGQRRRPLADLCDEMAWLWREKGVRYFYFVDEHLLPYEESAALEFLERLERGLRARGVGRYGIGTMLRSDRLTAAIVGAFADAGLVRAFVGIELATAKEALRYGRRSSPADARAILGAFAKADVATVSNLMLVHPDATPETISAGIDFLASLPAGVFEAPRMMVYHGTQLWERLRQEGRLTGNPLRYGYTFADPVMERFAVLHARLRAEALGNLSLAYRTHDALLALSLADRLEERTAASVKSELEDVRRSTNDLYVAAFRKALALACADARSDVVESLLCEIRAQSHRLGGRLEWATDRLTADLENPGRVFAPMSAAAASLVVFTMLGGTPGCGRGGGLDGRPADASVAAADASADAGTFDAGCTPAAIAVAGDEVSQAIGREVPCFTGSVAFLPGAAPDVEIDSFGIANPVEVQLCSGAPNQAPEAALTGAVRAAIPAADLFCLSQPPGTTLQVQGGLGQDAQTMAKAIVDACANAYALSEVVIVLDTSGKVQDVRTKADGGTSPLADCVRAALQGLTFPCMGGYQVCPEYVIAE